MFVVIFLDLSFLSFPFLSFPFLSSPFLSFPSLRAVIKVGPRTSTEEVVRTAVSKFMSVKNMEAPAPDKLAQNVVDSYALYLANGSEEKKMGAEDFPFAELEKLGLDEEQKKNVKFQLKKSMEMVCFTPYYLLLLLLLPFILNAQRSS